MPTKGYEIEQGSHWLLVFGSVLVLLKSNVDDDTVLHKYMKCNVKLKALRLINPLIPIVHFWLHHTAHCACGSV